MSKKLWITAGIVATAVGATVMVAQAERGGDGHGWRGHGDRYQDGNQGRHGQRGRKQRDMTKAEFDADTRAKFAAWDANSDGVVDRSEVETSLSERMEHRMNRRGGNRWDRMLRRFDTDKDGKVTKAEIEAMVTDRFQQLDLDGDGKITDADLPPMMRGMNILSGGDRSGMDMMGMGMMGMGGFHAGRHHGGRHGRGGHGMLRYVIGADTDKDGSVTLQELQDRAAKSFARFDRNSDGAIDQADHDAMRKEMTGYRVLRFMHRHGAVDGKLTLEQFTTARNERFAKRDVDGDDIIQRGEGRGWGHRGGGRGRHHDSGSENTTETGSENGPQNNENRDGARDGEGSGSDNRTGRGNQ